MPSKARSRSSSSLATASRPCLPTNKTRPITSSSPSSSSHASNTCPHCLFATQRPLENPIARHKISGLLHSLHQTLTLPAQALLLPEATLQYLLLYHPPPALHFRLLTTTTTTPSTAVEHGPPQLRASAQPVGHHSQASLAGPRRTSSHSHPAHPPGQVVFAVCAGRRRRDAWRVPLLCFRLRLSLRRDSDDDERGLPDAAHEPCAPGCPPNPNQRHAHQADRGGNAPSIAPPHYRQGPRRGSAPGLLQHGTAHRTSQAEEQDRHSAGHSDQDPQSRERHHLALVVPLHLPPRDLSRPQP